MMDLANNFLVILSTAYVLQGMIEVENMSLSLSTFVTIYRYICWPELPSQSTLLIRVTLCNVQGLSGK
jgi:presenilin-like A22 family membrane protease